MSRTGKGESLSHEISSQALLFLTFATGCKNNLLQLLENLQEDRDFTYLYITHDLSIVRNTADITSVMYLGEIVERGETRELFENPLHPYTRALLSAIPVISSDEERYKPGEITLKGNIPSPSDVPDYCSFYSRCPDKMKRCKRESPELIEAEDGHLVRCFLYQ